MHSIANVTCLVKTSQPVVLATYGLARFQTVIHVAYTNGVAHKNLKYFMTELLF